MKRHPMKSVLVSSADAMQAKGQHTKPCRDCPFGRQSLPGWIGELTVDEWMRAAHGDGQIDCHTALGAECAGAAIFRANVVKGPRTPVLQLPADRVRVFATTQEFRDHHGEEGRGERIRQAIKKAKGKS